MHRFGRIYDHVARHRLAPRARSMRLAPTPSEAAMWAVLRRGQLGLRFRRQVLIASFIVDFFAPEAALVVEVDGGIHRAHVHEDALRDAALIARGLRVLHIDAEVVLRDRGAAVALVREALPR